MLATRKLSEMTIEEKALLASPYGFGKYYLGLPIYDDASGQKVGECRDGSQLYYEVRKSDWQKRAVNSLEKPGGKTSARTANGAGKTTVLLPTAVLWWMTVYPRSKVVITSGVNRQVREQVFPALHAHKGKLPGWVFNDTGIDAPNGSHCIGFSTDEGGRFEGWHGNTDELYQLFEHDGPLLIVVDEAKSVLQTIFDAIDRCTYQHLLLASSCGPAMGEFYKSHTDNARFFQALHAPASLCPHADHAKNLELIQKLGLNHPLVRSKVFAEFMTNAAGVIVSRAWLDRNRANPAMKQGSDVNAFCDFAAGGDENVFALRRGNLVTIPAAWRERDTMKACGEFILHFRKAGFTPETAYLIAGDDDGLGHVVIDRLHELGWKIRRESNGSTADSKEDYQNRGAETWYEGAVKIEKNEIILPADDVLSAQLSCRTGRNDSAGRLAVESKEDMRKRGLESPDRADAVLGAMRGAKSYKPIPFAGQHEESMGLLERMIEEQGGVLAGAYCP